MPDPTQTALTDQPSKLDPPAQIGTYAVERLLGEGGMGRVYLCRDSALDRLVAIKMLQPALADQPTMTERFLREARSMAALTSPRVVAVYHVGTEAGVPYLVMEYLAGEDLARRVHRLGRLEPIDAVEHALDAIAGLRTAAQAGLVHRDVKPSNLFLVDGRVKLTDFGLARPVDGSSDLTQTGIIVGSPHYMAPELARGEDAGVRSDIYALGATLYELLAGRPPFSGKTPVEVVSQHLTTPVPDIAVQRPELDQRLVRIVRSMLTKDPHQRPGDYDALEGALLPLAPRLLAASGISAVGAVDAAASHTSPARAPATAQAVRALWRGRGRWGLLGLLLAAVVAAAIGLWPARGDDRIERIRRGEARAVLDEIEQKPATERDARDALVRGHALLALDHVPQALGAFREAASGGAVDAAMRDRVLAELDRPSADLAVEILTAWPDRAIVRELTALVEGGEWWERRHALEVLQERQEETARLEELLGILDLETGTNCGQRQQGLRRLKRVAASETALEAIRQAQQRGLENLCMLLEYGEAERAIRTRLDKAK
ncbi:MAG: serine/threonine protein kinase [Deltaproteobacteria bacterium]|nr:serine/threonine protein kinase [Deltaproteobacteria bacterium]